MATCTTCKAELREGARFCGACGAAAPEAPAKQADLAHLRTRFEDEYEAPAQMMAPGEVFAGRYEIKDIVGSGGMGSVYAARDRLVGETIALKVIRAERMTEPAVMDRLVKEGVVARNIRHPNIVSVFDVGRTGDTVYMSMEYLAGQVLRVWMQKRLVSGADCPFAVAADIVLALLDGLEAAHGNGVVHRDLKPENIMLLNTPEAGSVRLKILDFGLARAGPVTTGASGGGSMGTREYMAPEQVTAPEAVTPASDLYSLSKIFYELLADVLPQSIWHPPSAGRNDVPAGVDALISDGLSTRPRNRPQTAAEYRQRLLAIRGAAPAAVVKDEPKKEAAPVRPVITPLPPAPPPPPPQPAAPVTMTGTVRYGAKFSDGAVMTFSRKLGGQLNVVANRKSPTFGPAHAITEMMIRAEDILRFPKPGLPPKLTFIAPQSGQSAADALALAAAEVVCAARGVELVVFGAIPPALLTPARAQVAAAWPAYPKETRFLDAIAEETKAADDQVGKAITSHRNFLSIFLPVGRINRLQFAIIAVVLVYFFVDQALGDFFIFSSGARIFLLIEMAALIYLMLIAMMKRLHDTNQSWSTIFAILIGFPIGIPALLIVAGSAGRNNFGDPPRFSLSSLQGSRTT